MRNWQLRHIGYVWLGWTAILVLAWYAITYSNVFASVNLALPVPAAVGVFGHRFAIAAGSVLAILWALMWLYLPPILITLSWLTKRKLADTTTSR